LIEQSTARVRDLQVRQKTERYLTRIFHQDPGIGQGACCSGCSKRQKAIFFIGLQAFGQAGRLQPGENRIATIDSLGFCLIFL
jgi:hypothetical protein